MASSSLLLVALLSVTLLVTLAAAQSCAPSALHFVEDMIYIYNNMRGEGGGGILY